MNFAALLTVCLFGQITYSVDDSLNQWEDHLLESQWILKDPVTEEPRAFLVFKCFTPDHRIFALYLQDQWDGDSYRTLRCWTGTYKMERREKKIEYSEKEDTRPPAEIITRLKFEQFWIPVDSDKPNKMRRWMSEQGLTHWISEPDARHWSENLDVLHWTEEVDFKPFYAEFNLTPPSPITEPEVSSDCLHFLLRSVDVKKVGWWPINTEHLLGPVKKWRRSTTASDFTAP